MPGQNYNLIVSGQVMEGFDINEVRLAVAESLNIPASKAMNLLNGNPTIVHEGLDKKAANHYSYLLNKIGARTKIDKIPLLNASVKSLCLVPKEIVEEPTYLDAKDLKSYTAKQTWATRKPKKNTHSNKGSTGNLNKFAPLIMVLSTCALFFSYVYLNSH